ncbi:MAG: thioredoxin [Oscillospiraceae bacterium]|jgi:hypothetical protein|nr:thioredoxin [Oscillospiraceae bacterium]
MTRRESRREGGRRWISPTLIGCGTILIVIGVARGELGVILMKAIRVCMECVGIG